MRTLPLIVTLLFLTGCEATPSARWHMAQESLNATVDVVHLLARQGQIEDQQLADMGEAILVARAALLEAKGHLPEGSRQLDDYLRIVKAALSRLREIRETHIREIEHGNPRAD